MIVLKRVIINQTPTPPFCVSALFYHIRKKALITFAKMTETCFFLSLI